MVLHKYIGMNRDNSIASIQEANKTIHLRAFSLCQNYLDVGLGRW